MWRNLQLRRLKPECFTVDRIMNQELRIKKRNGGFTLIELLIVVAIIGILTTVLMANFIGIRQRARDVQRKGDLEHVRHALELYRADQGVYPQPGTGDGNFPTTCGSGSSLINGTTTYMQKIPCDPLGGSYPYSSDGNTYVLITCIENLNDSQKDTANNSTYCDGTTKWSFTLQNP